MLNGRATTTGRSKERWKLSASWSAPIFVAAYGDCAFSGCSSEIGTVWALPYTSLLDICTIRSTPPARAAWRTFSVPTTLTATYSRGWRNEYGIGITAPRWKTIARPSTACATASPSARSPL